MTVADIVQDMASIDFHLRFGYWEIETHGLRPTQESAAGRFRFTGDKCPRTYCWRELKSSRTPALAVSLSFASIALEQVGANLEQVGADMCGFVLDLSLMGSSGSGQNRTGPHRISALSIARLPR
jgi:hypothetical protein